MSDAWDFEKASREALVKSTEHAHRGLVLMATMPEDADPPWFATGIALLSPRGNPVVLTAEHNITDFKGRARFRTGQIKDFVHDLIADSELAPEGIEAGLIIPKPHARAILRRACVSYASVAESSDAAVTSYNRCRVAGFPSHAFGVAKGPQPGEYTYFPTAVTRACAVRGPNANGLFEVDWDTAELESGHEPPAPPSLEIKQQKGWDLPRVVGEPSKLPDAPGMSGGPLWRFEALTQGEDYLPEPGARIIGIVRHWDQVSTLFVEPVSRWGDWFRDALAKADAFVAEHG